MKAVVLNKPGGVEELNLKNIEKPIPQDNEVLVKVKAAAVNRTDIVSREGTMEDLTGKILGVEVSGIVEDIGGNVDVPIGKKVMGLVNRGGYGEYVIMHKSFVMDMPDNLTFEEAAAIPEVFLTAYQTLFWLAGVKDNEKLLIHAGASGVGTAAIQLIKNLRTNVEVFVTAGSDEKLKLTQSLGANHLINYKKQNFQDEISNLTQNEGVNVILDFIGAPYWQQNINSLSVDGRLVLIGILGGTIIKEFDLQTLLQKRIQVTGTLLTPRSNEYKSRLKDDFLNDSKILFEQKKIKPIVDSVFTIENIKEAHTYMEENKNSGKIILTF